MLETIKLIISEHRELGFKMIVKLGKSDLIRTYKGTLLGWSWALVKPMVRIFVFWFAFSIGMKAGKPVEGYPYILWLIAGFLPWFYMQSMLTHGAGCFRRYKHLITKIKFPVSTISTFMNVSELFVHFALLAITIAIFAGFGFYPDKYMLQLPIYMFMMFLFFNAWSLFAGMLSAISKDFLNLIKSITSALFWLSGIMYNIDKMHSHTLQTILKFNPVTIISMGYRKVFIYKQWIWEDMTAVGCYCITTGVFIVLAILAYKRLRKEIPDVL